MTPAGLTGLHPWNKRQCQGYARDGIAIKRFRLGMAMTYALGGYFNSTCMVPD